MSVPVSFADSIYKGGWINWSSNNIFGNTLTLSASSGSYVVSFLSLYVAIAGARFWVVVAFLIHQERANHKDPDGMHLQQQVILRNASTPTSAAMAFSKIAWNWRKNAKKPWRSSLLLLIVALLSLGTFQAGSLLSSRVSRFSGNETLIISPNCSYWGAASQDPFEQGGYRAKLAADVVRAAQYSRACYDDSASTGQCNIYATDKIPWTPVTNATCPFSQELCYSSPSAVYQMDTGYIDSTIHLGLNAHKRNRISYRKVTTCAPINATKFLARVPDGAGNFDNQYSLGWIPYLSYNGTLTYVYNNRTLLDRVGYQLSTYSSDVSAQWIPEISRTDADVSVFFLSQNSVLYQQRNNDLIFSANTPAARYQNGNTKSFYQPDNLVSVLGCADQHQLCTTSSQNRQCSNLTSLGALGTNIVNYSFFNPWQNATATRVWQAIWLSTMFYVVDPRGPAALRASESVFELITQQLPDDQWIREVSGWYNTSLAKVQQALVEIAAGPVLYPDVKLVPVVKILDKALCYKQIIRTSGEYLNFSVLGLVLVLTLSTFFILLSFVLDKVTGCVQRWSHTGGHRRMQWLLDESLQLHRLAYYGAQKGDWTSDAATIPVTDKYQVLPMSVNLPGNETALMEAIKINTGAKEKTKKEKRKSEGKKAKGKGKKQEGVLNAENDTGDDQHGMAEEKNGNIGNSEREVRD